MPPAPGDNRRNGEVDAIRARLPIVVGGCHRSGTTLVRRVLDSHSRLSCGPELKFLLDYHDGHTQEDPIRHARFTTTAKSHVPESEAFSVLGRAFVQLHERRAERSGKARWADKNPENAIYLDSWTRLLGDEWLFVNVVRDARDVLASMEEAGFPHSGPDRARRRAEHYRRYVAAARAFADDNPARSHTVQYEALIADPEAEIASLMRWLGEEPEAAQLDLRSEGSDGLGDPKADAAEPFASESVGRWRHSLDPEAAEVAERAMAGLGAVRIGA